MILRSRAALLVAVGVMAVIVVATAGCGSGDETDRAGGQPTLVATTSVWADITSRVACGEPVAAVIPAGADPHTYEPSLRDRELLESADLVVANGGELESSMRDLLTTAEANVVEVVTQVDLIVTHDHDNDDHDDGDHDHDDHDDDHDGDHDDGADEHGHTHEGGDPHIWLDPTRVSGALDLIASALVDRDLAEIRRCTDDYRTELEQLDADIAELFADIPPERRLLVSNHESLTYFADRYDFDIVGTVLPGTSTLAETNPAELERLADLMRERNIDTVFVEQAEADDDARALAERAGAKIVSLLTASLDDTGPTSTYVGMMRRNATTIADSLTTTP